MDLAQAVLELQGELKSFARIIEQQNLKIEFLEKQNQLMQKQLDDLENNQQEFIQEKNIENENDKNYQTQQNQAIFNNSENNNYENNFKSKRKDIKKYEKTSFKPKQSKKPFIDYKRQNDKECFKIKTSLIYDVLDEIVNYQLGSPNFIETEIFRGSAENYSLQTLYEKINENNEKMKLDETSIADSCYLFIMELQNLKLTIGIVLNIISKQNNLINIGKPFIFKFSPLHLYCVNGKAINKAPIIKFNDDHISFGNDIILMDQADQAQNQFNLFKNPQAFTEICTINKEFVTKFQQTKKNVSPVNEYILYFIQKLDFD